MSARWVSFGLWALIAASAVGWGFRLFVQAPPVPPDARVVDANRALRGEPTRVLGADPAAPATASAAAPVADDRFQLIGVVAPRSNNPALAAREGVALIAVDGKPPRAYRVGATIDEDVVLKLVRARGAELGPRDGAATIALELPAPPAAATGTLPAAGAGPAVPTAPVQPGLPGVRSVPPAGAPGAVPGAVPGMVPGVPPRPVPAAPNPTQPRLPNLQPPPPSGSDGDAPGVVSPDPTTRS